MARKELRAMSLEQRTDYFERYARYFADAAMKYSIRVGSMTLRSNDTYDLRRQFDKLIAKTKKREQ